MQRRGGSGQPAKGRRNRAIRPKARKASTARHSNSNLQEQLDQRIRERDEALEQLAATSEVLQVINSTPGDLKPVFQSILANAVRICEAKFGTLYRTEGDSVRCVAMHGVPKPFADERRRVPVIRPAPTTMLGRALATKRPAQIADVREYPDAPSGYTGVALPNLAGARTLLAAPMLTDVELVGAIVIYRQEVRPFTDKHIELVKSFAAQAVIAVENTRLLSELRQSLERQTATSEVLKIISSSPGDLQPVFTAMLDNAVRICEAKFGTLSLRDADDIRAVATTPDAPPAYLEARKQRGVAPDGPVRRAATTKQVVHVTDIRELQSYHDGHPSTNASVELGKIRTVLGVPMLKYDELIGVITINRQEVRPFTDKQIELVQNFAAQAVIAIENTRLLSDLNRLNQQLEQRVTDQVSEIERMSKLRRFLPPQVADLIIASGTEKRLESHRREITALFCDLRGFTGFSEKSDTDNVQLLLS